MIYFLIVLKFKFNWKVKRGQVKGKNKVASIYQSPLFQDLPKRDSLSSNYIKCLILLL